MYKFIFFKLLGWEIEGGFDPKVKKSIIIVVPHTSWHDFYIGVLTRGILNIPIHFIAKKELFKWPFGAYFKKMGGHALDRTPGQKKVDAIAKMFKNEIEFRLALAPEGTRKKVNQWKTGFYFIALKANIPIIPVAFDYKRKVVRIGTTFYPSGNLEQDLNRLQLFFKGIKGKTDL
ncbi:1-acyl-sn-glycerol-3-phosphate acyltransferase [uncultured Mesonia sp.]|uniref:1-acyl-sn-glycerol-3-phosphate acyltransferase n=1 Tax=uncultured Mesonia sp. TaxID=399731 RepID=UPI00374F1868